MALKQFGSIIKNMLIGIDASRVNIAHRTGTENYSFNVVKALTALGEGQHFRLYFRKFPLNSFVCDLTNNHPHVEVREMGWPVLWTQGAIALELLTNPVDVMFVSAHTMPVVRWPRQKFVVVIHGLEYMYMEEYQKFPQSLYLTKSTEFVAKYADHIVVPSEFTKKSLLEHGWGATEERITVIPEGVDTSHFKVATADEIERVRSEYVLERPYLFFISSIQPRKNVLGLLEAFALVHKQFELHELVLAGGHGWKFEEVLKKIDDLGLRRHVKILGRVPDEDVPALFSGADASVYPSFVEGFGLPVLESMACGTPVICSNTGALPEVAGDAAVQVDPHNSELIAEGMKKILSDASFHAELKRKGFEQIKKFTWDSTGEGVMEVLRKVVD